MYSQKLIKYRQRTRHGETQNSYRWAVVSAELLRQHILFDFVQNKRCAYIFRIIEQIQRELGLDQTTSLISVSARTGLHIDRLQSALLAFEWQNPALRSNAVAMRSTAYVLETHRQAQHGSTFYTCVFKGGPQLSVGSFVAVNKCCGKLVRLLPIGNALDTKDQCRDIRYGQPFVAVVDHGKHAFSARKQGEN